MSIIFALVLVGFLSAGVLAKRDEKLLPAGDEYPNLCDRRLFCEDYILKEVMDSGLFNDLKDYLDLGSLSSPDTTQRTFIAMRNEAKPDPIPISLMKSWLEDKFHAPSGVFEENFVPSDWSEIPEKFDKITDEDLRDFALVLNDEWKKLVKKIRFEGFAYNSRYSLYYLPSPFPVTGGRFREFHYWDTYWILKGLLSSGMWKTARGMLLNMVLLVEDLGFVPEGGRVYYQHRSGPPMFIPMVKMFEESMREILGYAFLGTKAHNSSFGIDYLDSLENELEFWLESRLVQFKHGGKERIACRYSVDSNFPRAEEFPEDYRMGLQLEKAVEKLDYFSEVKSASESGWLSSSRWMPWKNSSDFSSSDFKHLPETSQVLPVDLNALMCYNARVLAEYYEKVTGDKNNVMAVKYRNTSRMFAEVIKDLMYDPQSGSWFDFSLRTMSQRKGFYLSNVYPLWLDCLGDNVNKEQVGLKFLQYLKKNRTSTFGRRSPLGFPGGVPVSMTPDGLDWDFPNVYPPLVHVLVEALGSVGHPDTDAAAFRIAQQLVTSVERTYNETGLFFRMFDATNSGRDFRGWTVGKNGYAWTIGVTLDLIAKYGSKLRTKPSTSSTECLVSSFILTIIIFCVARKLTHFTYSITVYRYGV